MKTEDGVRAYWHASLAWKRFPGFVEGETIETLFRRLDPIMHHRSLPLQRQAAELSNMIVHGKIYRTKKPRKKLRNLVLLPVRSKQDKAAA